jgi:transposase InsO family protein
VPPVNKSPLADGTLWAPAKFVTTTIADPEADRALDKVDRQFKADGPDRLCVADITYVPTGSGFLYLAIVLDVWSRRIVGWAMANHLRTELVLDAFDKRCREAKVIRSMGSIDGHSRVRPRRGWRSSRGLKAGTTRIAVTFRSATCHR